MPKNRDAELVNIQEQIEAISKQLVQVSNEARWTPFAKKLLRSCAHELDNASDWLLWLDSSPGHKIRRA